MKRLLNICVFFRRYTGIKGTGHVCLFVSGATAPQWAMASSLLWFLDHTQRRTTFGRTPVDEWSARRRDIYLTTHTILKTDKRPCSRWDSNTQSQQASGRRVRPNLQFILNNIYTFTYLTYKPKMTGHLILLREIIVIIIISNLSNDRSKASSKTIPPHSAI